MFELTETLLMCPPDSYSALIANNIWMAEQSDADRSVNHFLAHEQFDTLYRFIASHARVYLLPAPRHKYRSLQDQVFVANLGVSFPECGGEAVLSNFTVANRRAEVKYGAHFFESMGMDYRRCPFRFEGEAELKRVAPGKYLGGFGQRTEYAALQWIGETYNLKVTPVFERDVRMYHLDCSICPLDQSENNSTTMVCTSVFDAAELAQIEKQTDIVDVTYQDACFGICNCVHLGSHMLMASHIGECKHGDDDYDKESLKIAHMEHICATHNLQLQFFNMSEFLKGGALLSCMVLHL